MTDDKNKQLLSAMAEVADSLDMLNKHLQYLLHIYKQEEIRDEGKTALR